MTELFATFMQHLVWALMLWVILFAVFAAIFARGQLTAFAAGVGRVLLSIVISPFIFIRRAVASVLGFTRAEEDAYRASDQYLLNKGMLVLQAIVIVAAIGALAAGVVATWVAWVPPSEVRRAAREYRVETEAQRVKAAKAGAAFAKLETEWNQKREAVISRYREERTKAEAAATQSMTGYEQSLSRYSQDRARQAFGQIRERARRTYDSRSEIFQAKEQLDRMVPAEWYWGGVSDWERQTMLGWNGSWLELTIARFDLANLPMEEIRGAEQPTYAEVKATQEREAATLAQMEAMLLARQEAASLKWKAAAMRALRSFVAFLLFVWFAGVFIEAGWLAIRIADDVRRLRLTAAPAQPLPPESLPPQPMSDETQPEVRLPVRDSGTRGVPAPSIGS